MPPRPSRQPLGARGSHRDLLWSLCPVATITNPSAIGPILLPSATALLGPFACPPPPSSREEAPLEPRCTDAGVATSTDTLGWPSAGPGAGRRPVTAGDHKDVCRARGHPARLAGQSVGSHSHLIPRGPAFHFLPLEHLGFSACKLQMLVVATLPKSYTDALNLARSGTVQTRSVCFTDAIRFMT